MTPVEKMLAGILVVGAMVGAGLVSVTWSDEPVQREIDDRDIFSRFSSVRELNKFFEDSQANGQYDSGYLIPKTANPDMNLELSDSGYSRTNVQVEGIDELDSVKTDGQYIYTATQEGVCIIQAYPPEQLSNLTFLSRDDVVPDAPEDAYVSFQGLFVVQDVLVVITAWQVYSYWYGYGVLESQATADPSPPWSVVSVFDVSDAANPELVYTAGVTGWTTAARLVDDTVYLIAQNSAYAIDDGTMLPMVSEDGKESAIPLSTIRYDPNMADPDAFTNILAVDIDDEDYGVISVVTGYSSMIYVSHEAMYITSVKYPERLWDWDERIMSEADTMITTIYRISYEHLYMGATAKGEVKGTLLNQFSMDEHESYLRVATNSGWINRTNSVYVLDSDLSVIGALEDIAPNESIYSSRFVGDTLYLVTFRQIDPLFVVDLSVPTHPEVAGEVTLPGFSTYLHMLDRDHLIGIGSESGKAKITMFDVSDPSNPAVESTWVLEGYQWSSTVWDHKEVLFDSEKALLVVPITAYSYSYNYSTEKTLNAEFVFRVSADDGVELRGYVECNLTGYYYGSLRRALYIGEYLYTVWDSMVKVSLLSDLSFVGSLEYFTNSSPYYRVMT